MQQAAARVESLLATLNSTDVGTLESIRTKLELVRDELIGLEQAELAARAGESIQALLRGDVTEFKRARAFLQSKIGHLR